NQGRRRVSDGATSVPEQLVDERALERRTPTRDAIDARIGHALRGRAIQRFLARLFTRTRRGRSGLGLDGRPGRRPGPLALRRANGGPPLRGQEPLPHRLGPRWEKLRERLLQGGGAHEPAIWARDRVERKGELRGRRVPRRGVTGERTHKHRRERRG